MPHNIRMPLTAMKTKELRAEYDALLRSAEAGLTVPSSGREKTSRR